MSDNVQLFAGPASRYKVLLFSVGGHFSPPIFSRIKSEESMALLERYVVRTFFDALKQAMADDQRIYVQAAEAGQELADNYTHPRLMPDTQGPAYNFDYMNDLNQVLMVRTF
jgi:hypothetical protein